MLPLEYQNNHNLFFFLLFRKLAGLFLTKPEVRKDIRDIQRTLNADSDSEGSVLSEDVLDCRNDYPVKPRKIPRWGSGLSRDPNSLMTGPESPRGGSDELSMRTESQYYDPAVVDNTMAFLMNIQLTNKEFWDREQERDRLDSLRQSIQHNVLLESKRIHTVRKEQEGYFRALQGVHMRGMLLQNAHARQNTMTWDVLTALKRRKAHIALLDAEIQRLKTLYSNSKPIRSTAKNKDGQKNGKVISDVQSDPATTSVLRIALQGTSKEAVLFRGQIMQTPMGSATIVQIVPSEEKVVLKLPFGMMYAHLRRVLCWGAGVPQEETSDRGAPFGDTLDLSSNRSLALRWKGLRYALTVPAESSRGITSILGTLSDAEQAANVAAVAAEPGEEPGASEPVESAEAEEADPESDNRLLFSISQGSMGGVELMQQYFLPVVNDPSHQRTNLQVGLAESIGHNMLEPRLVVGAPQALPFLIREKLQQKKTDVDYCLQALGGNNAQQPGVTGALTWDANTESMKKALAERMSLIKQLEEDLYRMYKDVSASRRRAAKLAVETCSLRMNMFTRRVRHRNNLSEKGVTPSVPLIVQPLVLPATFPTASTVSTASTGESARAIQAGTDEQNAAGTQGHSIPVESVVTKTQKQRAKATAVAPTSSEPSEERKEAKRPRSAETLPVKREPDVEPEVEREDISSQISASNPLGSVLEADSQGGPSAINTGAVNNTADSKNKSKRKRVA